MGMKRQRQRGKKRRALCCGYSVVVREEGFWRGCLNPFRAVFGGVRAVCWRKGDEKPHEFWRWFVVAGSVCGEGSEGEMNGK